MPQIFKLIFNLPGLQTNLCDLQLSCPPELTFKHQALLTPLSVPRQCLFWHQINAFTTNQHFCHFQDWPSLRALEILSSLSSSFNTFSLNPFSSVQFWVAPLDNTRREKYHSRVGDFSMPQCYPCFLSDPSGHLQSNYFPSSGLLILQGFLVTLFVLFCWCFFSGEWGEGCCAFFP